MPAYLIVTREGPMREPAEMEEYQRRTRQLGGGFELTPLVAHGTVHGLEGTPPEAVVVLRFPTVEEARAWYESPGYQAALPHRLRSADWRAIIVEGL